MDISLSSGNIGLGALEEVDHSRNEMTAKRRRVGRQGERFWAVEWEGELGRGRELEYDDFSIT